MDDDEDETKLSQDSPVVEASLFPICDGHASAVETRTLPGFFSGFGRFSFLVVSGIFLLK